MWKSIVYKEWIKTRSTIAITVAIFLGVGIYTFLKINEGIRLTGIGLLWDETVQKDPTLFSYFRYLPVLAGILFAITQYIPELHFKRLKLTLHLPMKENSILLTMLLYGVTAISLLLLVTLPLLLWGLSQRFPAEIVYAGFQQLTPWFLAGPAAYLIASWVCLEPQWKQRIMNVVPGLLFLSLFVDSAKSGAFGTFNPFLIGVLIVSFFFPFYSTVRFKEGVQ